MAETEMQKEIERLIREDALMEVNGCTYIIPSEEEMGGKIDMDLESENSPLVAFSDILSSVDEATGLPTRYVILAPLNTIGINEFSDIVVDPELVEWAHSDPESLRTLLLHEKGHQAHQDVAFDCLREEAPVEIAKTADLLDRAVGYYLNNPDVVTKNILMDSDHDLDKALATVDEMGQLFSQLEARYAKADAYVRSYPGFEELKAATLAGNPEAAAHFQEYMKKQPEVSPPEESMHLLGRKYFGPVIVDGETEPAIDPEQEAQVLNAIKVKQEGFKGIDAQAVRQATRIAMHMTEYRADMYAVERDGDMAEAFRRHLSNETPEDIDHPCPKDRRRLAEACAELRDHMRSHGESGDIARAVPQGAALAVARVNEGIKPLHNNGKPQGVDSGRGR